jgi:hypothetical protein
VAFSDNIISVSEIKIPFQADVIDNDYIRLQGAKAAGCCANFTKTTGRHKLCSASINMSG